METEPALSHSFHGREPESGSGAHGPGETLLPADVAVDVASAWLLALHLEDKPPVEVGSARPHGLVWLAADVASARPHGLAGLAADVATARPHGLVGLAGDVASARQQGLVGLAADVASARPQGLVGLASDVASARPHGLVGMWKTRHR